MIDSYLFVKFSFVLIMIKLCILFLTQQSELTFILLVLCISFDILITTYSLKPKIKKIYFFFLVFLIFLFIRLFSGMINFSLMETIMNELGGVLVLYMAARVALIKEYNFISLCKFGFKINTIAVFIFFIFTITTGAVWTNAHSRLEVGGLGPGVIASWGLGILLLALFTNKNHLMIVGLVVCFGMAILTEMRTVGVSATMGVLVYFLLHARERYGTLKTLLIFIIFIAAISPLILNFLTFSLMLDDPNRGVDSGFSGRLLSWTFALSAFFESPIVGVGVSDYRAAGAYSGYLRIFTKFGIFIGLIFILLIIISLILSVKQKQYAIATAITTFALWFLVVSKDFDFEIMPFLGFVAIFKGLRKQVN